MPLSMYQACVPVITQMLNGLSGVVDKGAAHCAEKKYEESALLQARLFPDMFTFVSPASRCPPSRTPTAASLN
jgi:hypothetical protein